MPTVYVCSQSTVLSVHTSLYDALCAKCVCRLTSTVDSRTFEVRAVELVPAGDIEELKDTWTVNTDLDYCHLDSACQSRVDTHRHDMLEREKKLHAEKELCVANMRHSVRRLTAVLHYKTQMGVIEGTRSEMVARLIARSMTAGEYRENVGNVCKQESVLREELAAVGRKLCAETKACFEDVKTLFAPPFTLE